MEIMHRVLENFKNPSKDEARALKRLRELGFDLEEELVTIEVAESDPSWPEIREIVRTLNAPEVVYTKFTRTEKKAAPHLEMFASSSGYPQPDEPFEFKKATYDVSQYCANCGVGARQNAPFRLSKAPKWGSRVIFQLNWVYDEFFVRPDVWERVFQPFGVGCREVVHHRSGEVLENVVQLRVDDRVPLNASDLTNQPSTRCVVCDREKYSQISRGFFPSLGCELNHAMVKSGEWFGGEGAAAKQAVIVSHELFTRISEEKLKGAEFIPAQPK